LKPDELADEEGKIGDSGVMLARLVAFFVAEPGD
jgi:hypothetical protein